MTARAMPEGEAEPLDLRMPAPVAAEAKTAEAGARRPRARRVVVMLVLPLALVAAGGYWWLTGGRIQETDNANLRQAKVTIVAEASGRIVEANVADNQPVKAGDLLFTVDPEPYRIALAQADAALATARLNVEQLRAAHSQAVAQEQASASEVAFLDGQLVRQRDLSGKGIASRAALEAAERDLRQAQEKHTAAKEAVAGALAALGGTAEIMTDRHPSVLAALAARDKAAYALRQTMVRAPADGIVSQASSFKTGQFVSTGTPLFSLVETDDTWVDANFKETQLTNIRPGQKAEVILDTYPDRTFSATIESIGAGTGAEFALLPAQNATGNWVKVTQRVPVRLKLDTKDTELALRTGMSATVAVDTGVSRSLGGLFGTANAAE